VTGRIAIAILVLGTSAAAATAETASQSYWLFLRNDGYTWCGYRDSSAFKSAVADMTPMESGRVVFSSKKLLEVTYQITPESGDWIVIDQYTTSDDTFLLRRTNLLAQANLQIVQEAAIREGKATPFRLVTVTTPDGQKAKAPPTLDFPAVPVLTNLARIPFMAIVDEMRKRSMSELCKKPE